MSTRRADKPKNLGTATHQLVPEGRKTAPLSTNRLPEALTMASVVDEIATTGVDAVRASDTTPALHSQA